jgi:hypothetical protein
MSGISSRAPMGRIAISVAIALVALILTSFLGARPDSGSDINRAVPFDIPASGPWCGPRDAFGIRSCRYLTFDECLTAMRTIQGTCRPNPAAVVVDEDAAYRTYRPIFR